MAKHPKKSSPPQKPVSSNGGHLPSGLAAKLIATAVQTAPSIGVEAPDWSEQQVAGLLEQLPQEVRDQFRSFVETFSSMGALLKDSIARAESSQTVAAATKSEYEKKLASLAPEEERLKQEQDGLTTRVREVQSGEEALKQRLSEASAKERQLEAREAEVRSGLFTEQQKALQSLRNEIAELERQRAQVPVQIEADRQQLLNDARALAEQLMSQLRKRSEEWVQREDDLVRREAELDRRDELLRMNEVLLKARRESLTKEIEEQFEQQLRQKNERVARLESLRSQANQKLDKLAEELAEFQDLKDQFPDGPQQLLDQLEAFKQRNRDLDQQVQELLANRSEGDAALLRSQRDSLQERLTAAEDELFELRRRESEWRRSVSERENWQRERFALQKSRDLLADSVDRLQNQVDGLINREKDATPFPELTRMDVQFATPAVTQRPPMLQNLVADLQARIAFAEKGKQLHFRAEDLQLFVGGLAMSQLHILQGISGTGKTSLATAFAKAVGGVCTTVPVQAGWRDRADLLGHYNAFEKRYYERNTLQAIYRAQTDGDKDRLHVVLLDEMNLSRPEQYFAEFLSAMEMPESDRWINLMEARPAHGVPAKFRDGRDIRLPPNLWFIGTANHDETTSAFADKTHDRAFVLDLPKHESPESALKAPTDATTWQYPALKRLFDDAATKGSAQVHAVLEMIEASDLTKILQEDFDLGWGNRLERQMSCFLPVVVAVGGTDGLAVDHLLCTRMFRDGKVVGRHDVRSDDLRKVERALSSMWKAIGLKGEPKKCLRQLVRDIKRLERGG